ncbi:MAG TPA: OmpH family outer membrane protein, partial [Verrucomicrobiae bacterium]|nr:OmpH family outer membrane protein [Verrucomicrobiae bacterium]
MKKMIPALCLTFALASVCGAAENAAPAASAEPAAPTAPAPAKPKVVIGYVDVRRIVYGSKAGEEAKAILQKKTEKLQSQIKSREKQLETLKSTLEKQAPKMTEAQRRAKAQEFEKKVNDFRDFLKKAEKEMSAQ